MPDQPEVLTVPEAAQFLRISEQTVYKLMRSGALHGVKAGKSWRVHRDTLVGYLKGQPRQETDG